MTVKYSVIVCTYNGKARIEKTIKALLDQTVPKNEYEIIIVNDGSTDGTEKIIDKYPIKIITQKNKGLPAARNIGVKHSKGCIILFTDDDCIPDKKWIEQIVDKYSDIQIGSVGGGCSTYKNDKIILKYYSEVNPLSPLSSNLNKSNNILYRFFLYVKRQFIRNKEVKNGEDVFSLPGANFSFRKELIKKTGFFDENIKFSPEDTDFCIRFNKKSGLRMIYITDGKIYHDYDPGFLKFLKTGYNYGKGSAILFYKYKEIGPTIFPYPLIPITLLFISFTTPLFSILSFFSVLIIYIHFTIKGIVKFNPIYFVFPYLQFLEELLKNIGFFVGIITYKDFKYKGG